MKKIRNFCIIAHIDHGKSTISDRMLEITNTIEGRKMKAQLLDTMDIEQERGITIKLQPVTMKYKDYTFNLIDTPGHVDFTYEVSRSLAACEAAVLLVDSTQGIQAQTLANLYLALDQDLTIIPVANKTDLPASNIEKTKREIVELLGCNEDEILCASGKTGEGVTEILDIIIEKVPAPIGDVTKPVRALIFDSNYDEYKGVVAYVRMIDGKIAKKDKIKLLATRAESEANDVGIFKPDYFPTGILSAGEIGYVVTGFKNVEECGVGDTLTLNTKDIDDIKPLKGYSEVKPMVYAGIFPKEGNEYEELRDAIEKLKLNDSALVYEAEHSDALGFGFRCGFLGILHLEIFQERLRREYNIELIVTVPSVSYKILLKNGTEVTIRTPQQFPKRELIEQAREPWVKLDIITPSEFVGSVMGLAQDKRGMYKTTEYIDETRAILHYDIPMSAILTDFYDKIKSATQGYASINYDFLDYKETNIVKMDILVAEEIVESLSLITYTDDVQRRGKEIVHILKESLPRQMFVIKLQASVGGKIIAGDRLSAMRKDVTAKLYGGDVSRKKKLLQKQKAGKKKMMASGKGSVDIPSDTFIKLLKK